MSQRFRAYLGVDSSNDEREEDSDLIVNGEAICVLTLDRERAYGLVVELVERLADEDSEPIQVDLLGLLEVGPAVDDEPELSAHGIPEGENDPGWPDGTPDSVKGPVHWVRAVPERKSAELRGFHCGAPFDARRASSYRDQITCEACLDAADRN